jgi:hypothetical protein
MWVLCGFCSFFISFGFSQIFGKCALRHSSPQVGRSMLRLTCGYLRLSLFGAAALLRYFPNIYDEPFLPVIRIITRAKRAVAAKRSKSQQVAACCDLLRLCACCDLREG